MIPLTPTVQGALTIFCLINTVGALQQYQNQIPNGNKVPHPCDRSTIWTGVGHQNPNGAGTRNQFGLDFATNGHVWTGQLCRMDSDGDGILNGAELGDPNCVWTVGATPSVTMVGSLTHPGVCEPITSANCMARNSFINSISSCSAQLTSSSSSSSTSSSSTASTMSTGTSTSTATTTKSSTSTSSSTTKSSSSTFTTKSSPYSTPTPTIIATVSTTKATAASSNSNSNNRSAASTVTPSIQILSTVVVCSLLAVVSFSSS